MNLIPRIIKTRPAFYEIGHVPRDHRQPVFQRGGCQDEIIGQKLRTRKQAAQPLLEDVHLAAIGGPLVFDSTPDFCQSHHAECAQARVICHCTSLDATVRVVASSQLGNEIGIEQVAHQSSTSRRCQFRSSRPNSKSGAISPNCLIWSKRFRFSSTAPARACCKIRRCSSSAETPCSAARSLSVFASVSGMSRSNNCAGDQKCYHCYHPPIQFFHAQ